MEQELRTMLTLQEEMNCRVHPQWRQQNYCWYRAIWLESAELLDHYGWKWWKKQQLDREQVELELIDIWHFGLSDMLQRQTDHAALAAAVGEQMTRGAAADDFPQKVEAFAQAVLQNKSFDVVQFAGLLATINMPFERLVSGYVGKNVLNFFRQDHGYQEGTYVKLWHGREDNEHLVEVLAELDSRDPDFREQLYRALKKRYPDSAPTIGASDEVLANGAR